MNNYSKYPPNWKTEIRPFILKRDKFTCQHCGKKHNQLYFDFDLNRTVRTIIHIAHLDHDAENWDVKMNRLLSLCGKCHLVYDNHDNIIKRLNSEKRRLSKKERERNKIKRLEKKYYYFDIKDIKS